MDKRALIRSVVAQLERELARQMEAALGSRSEATDAESKAEGKFDMRSQSAAYLAAGQARLASEIGEAIASWRTLALQAVPPLAQVALGALVTLEAGGQRAAYLVGPSAGGLEARDGENSATVVTAASPLGRQLVGRRAGDSVRMAGRLGPVLHRIASVD